MLSTKEKISRIMDRWFKSNSKYNFLRCENVSYYSYMDGEEGFHANIIEVKKKHGKCLFCFKEQVRYYLVKRIASNKFTSGRNVGFYLDF